MSADEELLFAQCCSAVIIGHCVISDDFTGNIFSCKIKRKRAKRLWMRLLLQRQHKY